MAKAEKKAPNVAKRSKLNVIYFFDSNKTRSFTLSITKVKALVVAGTLTLAWALSSGYLSLQTYSEKEMLSERLQAALSTIFEYQSRYDGVYELAYPSKIRAKKGNLLSEHSNKVEKLEPTDDSTNAVEMAEIEEEQFSLEKLAVASFNKDWPVSVEDVSVHKDQNEINLSLAIRNNNTSAKSDGYIWAVAKIISEGGKVEYIGAPSGIKIGASGEVENPQTNANRYSIRYYKAKSFFFAIPPNWSGHLEEITLHMMEKNNSKTYFRIQLGEKYKIKEQIAKKEE